MIAVCITTYNHEPFIAQAIDSARMQQCEEPIRIYVGDDASTDGTKAICEQCAKQDKRIVYIRRERNMGLVDNTIDLYRRIMDDNCDFIAMLDGDDFWTDANKLQLQINYLRSHPECGFVHTNGRTFSGSNKWTFGQRQGVYGLDSPGFANCTVVFRTELLEKSILDEIEAQHFLWLDYPLYGIFYQKTNWHYLPVETAVWRDHTSVSQPKTAQAILALREEKCRMWKWLDSQFPGKTGYSAGKAEDYLYEQRLNLIYQFDDRSLITPALLKQYHPQKWKQRVKQLGLKSVVFYTILQKISLFICTIQQKVVPL